MAGDNGNVPANIVLEVLIRYAVVKQTFSVAVQGNLITLVRDGIPEVQQLPDPVIRRLLQRFQGKYGVPIEYFYHPEMLETLH